MRLIASVVRLWGFLALVALLSSAARAGGSQDRTQFGRNISIAAGDRANDVTCFGCSVRIRGHVTSDVTVFGGSVIVEDQAEVDGDLTAFAGRVRLDDGVKVGGDVTVFGGHLHRDPRASIGGDLTYLGGPGWIVLIILTPFVFFGVFLAFIVLPVALLALQLMRPSLPAAA